MNLAETPINGLVVMICEHCNHKIVTNVKDNKMICPCCKKEGTVYRMGIRRKILELEVIGVQQCLKESDVS